MRNGGKEEINVIGVGLAWGCSLFENSGAIIIINQCFKKTLKQSL